MIQFINIMYTPYMPLSLSHLPPILSLHLAPYIYTPAISFRQSSVTFWIWWRSWNLSIFRAHAMRKNNRPLVMDRPPNHLITCYAIPRKEKNIIITVRQQQASKKNAFSRSLMEVKWNEPMTNTQKTMFCKVF